MSEQKVLSEKDAKRLEDIKTALNDRSFVETLADLESPEEVQAAFKEKSVELSLDEISQIKNLMNKVNENDGSLSDEDLDNIVGGINILKFISDVVNAIAGLFTKHKIKW